jgi:uncharacterized protein (TIGR02246 family)
MARIVSPMSAAHTGRAITVAALSLAALAGLAACTAQRNALNQQTVRDLATRYTAAWCSQDPTRVASFFVPDGSLKINDGTPSVGRAAIATAAQGFMTAFPDLVVRMDGLTVNGGQAVYRWTLTGTNTGPGGTGRAVRISGYEEWTLSADGLIERSLGHFDGADYDRQLKDQ